MVDYTIKKPVVVLYDFFVRVQSLLFSINIFVLNYEIDFKVSIILARSFLMTGKTLVDMKIGI